MKSITKAFTLIELLIVIVIIGILAVALIPRLSAMGDRARYVRVEKDFYDFRTLAFMAQTTSQKSLTDITGSHRSAGSCDNARDIRNISSLDPCMLDWISSLRKIELAAGEISGSYSHLERDPWGSPYRLDENENQSGHILGLCGAKDNFGTVGADGIRASSGGILYTGDNKTIFISPLGCAGGY